LSNKCLVSSADVVACGGLATDCVETRSGYVACGGLAAKCIVSSTDRVACGGDRGSRQAYPPSMRGPMFQQPVK
jgi:hypothetical protein